MPQNFTIGQGDRLPPIRGILKDSNGVAVDISGATVKFNMKLASGATTAKVSSGATVNSAPAGDVQYDWALVDTDTPGAYNGEFEVTFGSGKVETFPNRDDQKLQITVSHQVN